MYTAGKQGRDLPTEGPSLPAIHELLARRSSPSMFDPRSVSQDDLVALFEAARWSASAGNEQPWSYILATREDTGAFERLLSCISECNAGWAKDASVLVIGCVRRHLSHGGPYLTAEHDLGLASANLVFEATARGLGVHQMTMIDRDKIRRLYEIPENIGIITALAIGYATDPKARTKGNSHLHRTRKPLRSFVFTENWENVWAPISEPHNREIRFR